jgi:hypothetical protein
MVATQIDVAPTSRVAVAKILAAGSLGGFVAGAVVAGLGGRLAMFVLRLTSDPFVRGLESDDGFVMGRFSLATAFLVMITALIGTLGGLAYLVVRPWFPSRWRLWLTAGFAAVFAGAGLVTPGGVDFGLLSPPALAIALFVALPAAYGAALSLLVERWIEPGSRLARSKWWPLGLAPVLALAATGPAGITLALVLAAIVAAAAWGQRVARWWTSTPVRWAGRVVLAAGAAFFAWRLAADAIEIL